MKNPATFGIISYNLYCNFTNYGSALQSWAMQQAVNGLGKGRWQAKMVDYCPDILADKDPLNPMKNMWDKDPEARRLCELTLPAIRKNYEEFNRFYRTECAVTEGRYTSRNFDECVEKDRIDGFVCGSDTIFCVNEFGFDDGYYANYPSMKGNSVAFAASFGDAKFTDEQYPLLDERLQNFRYIALREKGMVPYVQEKTKVPVTQVIDPTLLLEPQAYEPITAEPQEEGKYLLMYARRYNPAMEAYAQEMAAKNGWKIVEISLRAENARHHRMFYEAGVEQFLSLVKHAAFMVTNSYHGMIFAVQMQTPFCVFSREQCDTKIAQLLRIMEIENCLKTENDGTLPPEVDFTAVHRRIAAERDRSLQVMEEALTTLCR